ncbi:hypothetical protein EYF80_015516 [Liparis tanakae]|uniref:Uncharacterized protein n=1 Tax=Liparis tanakae TaxID=230148 RepID=A0A4Z2IAW4_9TELE|nr:hypothetical protein EYF80_015516 [Liparis tanakae]
MSSPLWYCHGESAPVYGSLVMDYTPAAIRTAGTPTRHSEHTGNTRYPLVLTRRPKLEDEVHPDLELGTHMSVSALGSTKPTTNTSTPSDMSARPSTRNSCHWNLPWPHSWMMSSYCWASSSSSASLSSSSPLRSLVASDIDCPAATWPSFCFPSPAEGIPWYSPS